MDEGHGVLCLSCGSTMRPQIDRLDLNWAGDGPYARDDEFPGILAEVYGCTCGRVAIRPVRIELSRSRVLDAPRAGAA
jgi:hypothetical protein